MDAGARLGTLNAGVSGVQRLTANYIGPASGTDFDIVPYRTAPNAIVALLRNDVQMACVPK